MGWATLCLVTRLFTSGIETSGTFEGPLAQGLAGTAPLIVTGPSSFVHGGAKSLTNTAGSTGYIVFDMSAQGGARFRFRFYLLIGALPSADSRVFQLQNGASSKVTLSLTSTGTLKLTGWSTTVLGTSSALNTGQFYRVEASTNYPSGGGSAITSGFRIDGVDVVAETTADGTSTGALLTSAFFGMLTVGGGSPKVYVDDIACNSDAGTVHNSWPGTGAVSLLEPASDTQVGTWARSDAGGSNLFGEIDILTSGLPTSADNSLKTSTASPTTAQDYIVTFQAPPRVPTWACGGVQAGRGTLTAVNLAASLTTDGTSPARGSSVGVAPGSAVTSSYASSAWQNFTLPVASPGSSAPQMRLASPSNSGTTLYAANAFVFIELPIAASPVLTASQAQSAVALKQGQTKSSATQGSAATVVAASRTVARVLTAVVGQTLTLPGRVTSALRSLTQAQSPFRTASVGHPRSVTQASTITRSRAVSAIRKPTQAQALVLGHLQQHVSVAATTTVASLRRQAAHISTLAQASTSTLRTAVATALKQTQTQTALAPMRMFTKLVKPTQAQATTARRAATHAMSTATQAQLAKLTKLVTHIGGANPFLKAAVGSRLARVWSLFETQSSQSSTVRSTSATRSATNAQTVRAVRSIASLRPLRTVSPVATMRSAFSKVLTVAATGVSRITRAASTTRTATQTALAKAFKAAQPTKKPTQASTVSLTRTLGFVRTLSASSAQAMTLLRQARTTRTARNDQRATTARTLGKTQSAIEASTVMALKTASRVRAATQATSARTIAGFVYVLRPVGHLVPLALKNVRTARAATQAQATTITRSAGHAALATQAQAARVLRTITSRRTATQTQGATVRRLAGRSLTAVQTQAVTTRRTAGRVIVVIERPFVTAYKAVPRTVSATQASIAKVARTLLRFPTATQTTSAAVVRTPGKVLRSGASQTVRTARALGLHLPTWTITRLRLARGFFASLRAMEHSTVTQKTAINPIFAAPPEDVSTLTVELTSDDEMKVEWG